MKFSYKILLCSIMIMAAAFGFGGFFFVNYVFDTSMDRSIGQAMDDSSFTVCAGNGGVEHSLQV